MTFKIQWTCAFVVCAYLRGYQCLPVVWLHRAAHHQAGAQEHLDAGIDDNENKERVFPEGDCLLQDSTCLDAKMETKVYGEVSSNFRSYTVFFPAVSSMRTIDNGKQNDGGRLQSKIYP